MSQFNRSFFSNGLPPIKVEKRPDCWIIREVFYNPTYEPNPKPGNGIDRNKNIQYAEVVITIDFDEHRKDKSYRIKCNYKDVNFKRFDPYDLLDGYPFLEISYWRSKNGESLTSWGDRVATSEIIRPTDRDMNGGKTTAELRNETNMAEFRSANRHNKGIR